MSFSARANAPIPLYYPVPYTDTTTLVPYTQHTLVSVGVPAVGAAWSLNRQANFCLQTSVIHGAAVCSKLQRNLHRQGQLQARMHAVALHVAQQSA